MRYMRHEQHGVLPVEDTGMADKLRKLGWQDYDMPTKVLDLPTGQPITSDTPPAELTLAQRAEQLGIRVDGRWSEARLLKEIAAAEGKG